MHTIQKIASALLLVTMLATATGASALAAPSAETAHPPRQLTLQCDQTGCTAQTELPGMPGLIKTGVGLLLSLVQDQPSHPLGAAKISLDEDLVITLPAGDVTLPKANLDLELDENNRVKRLHGTAEVPFPSLGALANVQVRTPALAEVGLDTGKNLSHLHADLDEEHHYLFFSFRSGFDVSAKPRDTASPFELSVPAGQNATLMIDTEEPKVYLAGNVTVAHDGQLALVGKLIEPIQSLDALPHALPIRQRTQLAVASEFGKEPVDRAVEISAAHAVDAGIVGDWLGVEVKPLAVEGHLTVTRDGLLLQGVVSSSIAPDVILDANARLDAFIPFSGELEDAYLLVQAQADVPVAKITADATAKVSWPLDVETTAHVVRQPRSDDTSKPAGDTRPAKTPAVKQALASAGEWATHNFQHAGDAAARGGKWLARTAAAVADLLPSKTDAQ